MNGDVKNILAVDDNPSKLTLINDILSDTCRIYPLEAGAYAPGAAGCAQKPVDSLSLPNRVNPHTEPVTLRGYAKDQITQS